MAKEVGPLNDRAMPVKKAIEYIMISNAALDN
jgi:hypothetical protein